MQPNKNKFKIIISDGCCFMPPKSGLVQQWITGSLLQRLSPHLTWLPISSFQSLRLKIMEPLLPPLSHTSHLLCQEIFWLCPQCLPRIHSLLTASSAHTLVQATIILLGTVIIFHLHHSNSLLMAIASCFCLSSRYNSQCIRQNHRADMRVSPLLKFSSTYSCPYMSFSTLKSLFNL